MPNSSQKLLQSCNGQSGDVQTGIFFNACLFYYHRKWQKKSGEKHMQHRFLIRPPFQSNYKVSGNLNQAKKLWIQRNQMHIMLKKSFKLAPPGFNNLQ